MNLEPQQLMDRIGYRKLRIPQFKFYPKRNFLYKNGFFQQVTDVSTTMTLSKRAVNQWGLIFIVDIALIIPLAKNKSSLIFALIALAFVLLGLLLITIPLLKYVENKSLVKKANKIKEVSNELLTKFYGLRREYNDSAELTEYGECRTQLYKIFSEYCFLPANLEDKVLDIQQQYYQDELALYLENFILLNQRIPGVSKSDLYTLYGKGIVLASDLLGTKLYRCDLPQPAVEAILMWKDQHVINFKYIPQTRIIQGQQDDLLHEYTLKARSYQNKIRNISKRAKDLESLIKLRRAEIRESIVLLLKDLDSSEEAFNSIVASSESKLKVSYKMVILN